MSQENRTQALQTPVLKTSRLQTLSLDPPKSRVLKKMAKQLELRIATQEIARIHELARHARGVESMLLTGRQGGGKSALLEYHAQQRHMKMEDGSVKIPVLLVRTPISPTLMKFAEAILVALGDPAAFNGTLATKTHRIIKLLEICGVELVLIDDVQNLHDGTRVAQSMQILEWLKSLINMAPIPFVLAGLARSKGLVNMNPQLRRKFTTSSRRSGVSV